MEAVWFLTMCCTATADIRVRNKLTRRAHPPIMSCLVRAARLGPRTLPNTMFASRVCRFSVITLADLETSLLPSQRLIATSKDSESALQTSGEQFGLNTMRLTAWNKYSRCSYLNCLMFLFTKLLNSAPVTDLITMMSLQSTLGSLRGMFV